MSSPVVSLWVRAEPFTYGSLQVAPHPRLSLHNLKKIVPYAKSKGKLGFPKLSFSVWKHMACNKLQLSEELAWMYFSTSLMISDPAVAATPSSSHHRPLHWDASMASTASQDDRDHVRSQLSVDTLQFVLLLFIQQLHKISLRASLVSNEEWPLRSRSPSPDIEGRSTPTASKTLDEHSHMTFVLNNLTDMLELLVEPDSYGSGPGNEQSLTMEAVEALGFFINGSVDRNRSCKPLHEIASLQQLLQKTGYSKLSRSFSFRSLQSWLRGTLGQNPFGISSCIATGRRLSWPLTGEDGVGRVEGSGGKRGKIATNAQYVPPEDIKGNKIIIMSQVCKQTVVRSSNTLADSSVKIHRCHYSYIYLLSPLRSVSIEKCRHTTIVLGSVETVVHLNACEQVNVITAARRVSLSGSTLCFLHLLTPNRPLILGGNDTIVLAPYHTFYPKLEEHLAQVGLACNLNKWDQPFCVGPDHQEDLPVWELLSPKEFFVFNIPFDMEGSTTSIPGNLPSKYQRAVSQRERQIDSWQKMVKKAGLNKEQRQQFQALVETQFQVWLGESGHKRELEGLVAAHGGSPKK